RMGGGTNHRFGLDDGILIKDNHIVASGGVTPAITNARAAAHHLLRIEVECDTLDQLREAFAAGVQAPLLAHMPPDTLPAALAPGGGPSRSSAPSGPRPSSRPPAASALTRQKFAPSQRQGSIWSPLARSPTPPRTWTSRSNSPPRECALPKG